MPISPSQHTALQTLFFEERLSDRTFVERRNLLFASCFGLLIWAFSLSPNIPWLEVNAPANVHLVRGSVGLAVVYLVAMFLMYLWDDHRRWQLSETIIDLGESVERLTASIEAIKSAAPHITGAAALNQQQSAALAVVMKEVQRMLSPLHLSEVNQLWSNIRRAMKGIRMVTWLQRARLAIFDVGAPLLLGVSAAWVLGSDTVAVLRQVFERLSS
jgi:hypothetical protein